MSIQSPVTATIAPKRRPWGLLVDVADEIEGVDRSRIGGGVTVIPLGCTGFSTFGADACATEGSIDLVDEDDCTTFVPFGIGIAEEANTRDYDADYLRSRAGMREAVMLSAALAEGLMGDSDPSLPSSATVFTTGDGLSPLVALEAIEESLAASLHGGQGMVHITPAGLQALSSDLTFERGQWHTASGHLVVADAGYTDQPPEGESAPAGVGWMYGSGPVQYLIGSPFQDSGANAVEYLDRTTNTMTVGTQRFGVVIFEPCAVVAARYVYDYEFYGS